MQNSRVQGPKRFQFVKPTLALFPGSGIAGEIDFSKQPATPVVDEVTARKNAHEFSSFLNDVSKRRRETWDQYWERKIQVGEKILGLELEAYNESQQLYAEEDFSDEEHPGRRHRFQPVPITTPNPGAFDLPRPEPVTIPDPRAYR